MINLCFWFKMKGSESLEKFVYFCKHTFEKILKTTCSLIKKYINLIILYLLLLFTKDCIYKNLLLQMV